ncbi:host attachment family protein [Halomonas sp. McH1-25]|uniref:host attachment protein n=1 Tax=unclassified Halomonas TaxID=2609666 RepID=UPI001EF5ACEE|nr:MULTISPECIES: host attachment family protein [unclassified Halomonas]MCG7600902.1 host attachment family protein [Halomonas sp. McH1-25]MCP1341490.1 host attachment family protein [Halomonas sp. FL8]MCP1360081.1 host attachment family protein [Halomonas sp. BBD45]MCP1367998.1 host attachment family protein [Halomonas sp. BBD48]
MKTTGILVADQTLARLFTIRHPKDPLEEIADLNNAKGRLHDSDIDSDRPGRTFDTMGMGRHAMSKQHSATTQQEIRFAGLIGDLLADHLRRDDFQRLVLCAPPKLLGFLREALSEPVVESVFMELGKDFVHLEEKDIRAHLMKELPAIVQPARSPAA